MSIKNLLLSSLILIVGASSQSLRHTTSTTINSNKLKAMKKRSPASQVHGKLSAPFNVEITTNETNEIKKGDTVELVARVVAKQETPVAEIEWVLFKGFEHISENIKFIDYNLKAQEVYEYRIVLKKINDEESVVHFSIITNQNQVKIGGGNSFSTNELGQAHIDKMMKANETNFLIEHKHQKIIQ